MGDVDALLPICFSFCVQQSGPHWEYYGAFRVVLSPVTLLLLSETMGRSINETNTVMSEEVKGVSTIWTFLCKGMSGV